MRKQQEQIHNYWIVHPIVFSYVFKIRTKKNNLIRRRTTSVMKSEHTQTNIHNHKIMIIKPITTRLFQFPYLLYASTRSLLVLVLKRATTYLQNNLPKNVKLSDCTIYKGVIHKRLSALARDEWKLIIFSLNLFLKICETKHTD